MTSLSWGEEANSPSYPRPTAKGRGSLGQHPVSIWDLVQAPQCATDWGQQRAENALSELPHSPQLLRQC